MKCPRMPVRDLGAQDLATGGGVEGSPRGQGRRGPMPTASANFAISRKDGAKPTGSWLCATRRNGTPARTSRAIPVVRHAGVQLPGLRDGPGGADRCRGVVLQPAGGAENLIKEANNDAGLAAHPSARWTMNCNSFPVGHAGLQPELLADAVQPRGRPKSRPMQHTTLATIAPAVSVRGGQDLAARRTSRVSATAITTRRRASSSG